MKRSRPAKSKGGKQPPGIGDEVTGEEARNLKTMIESGGVAALDYTQVLRVIKADKPCEGLYSKSCKVRAAAAGLVVPPIAHAWVPCHSLHTLAAVSTCPAASSILCSIHAIFAAAPALPYPSRSPRLRPPLCRQPPIAGQGRQPQLPVQPAARARRLPPAGAVGQGGRRAGHAGPRAQRHQARGGCRWSPRISFRRHWATAVLVMHSLAKAHVLHGLGM